MSNAQLFLITYGLHNFVTHTEANAKHAFFIRGMEGLHMISHAKHLIKEMFREPADIQVV